MDLGQAVLRPLRILVPTGDAGTQVEHHLRDARRLLRVDEMHFVGGLVVVLVVPRGEEDRGDVLVDEMEVITPEEGLLLGLRVLDYREPELRVLLEDAVRERAEVDPRR